MHFLLMDTSGAASFIALFKGQELIKSCALSDKSQSKELLPALKQLLKDGELSLDAIDFIAIGRGPGSFTGTRIGVMVAKTLNFARSIPLVPFCSLERFVPTRDGRFAILIDARSSGCYLLEGNRQKEEARFCDRPRLIRNEELPTLLQTPSTLFLSPHPKRLAEKLKLATCPIIEAALNPTFLAKRCSATFREGTSCQHRDLTVSYLHAP